MTGCGKEYEPGLYKKVAQPLHSDKIKTHAERATYIARKLAFVTGLLGLSSLNRDIDLH